MAWYLDKFPNLENATLGWVYNALRTAMDDLFLHGVYVTSRHNEIKWNSTGSTQPEYFNYSDIIRGQKSPTILPILQQLVRVNNKQSTPRITDLLWGESTGDMWIPLTKGKYVESFSMPWRHHVYDHMNISPPSVSHIIHTMPPSHAWMHHQCVLSCMSANAFHPGVTDRQYGSWYASHDT